MEQAMEQLRITNQVDTGMIKHENIYDQASNQINDAELIVEADHFNDSQLLQNGTISQTVDNEIVTDSAKGFSQRSSKYHVRTHRRERLFQCDFCLQKYSSSSTLRVHIWTHKARPFQCGLCFKIFFLKENLDFHKKACGLRTHNLRPFKCDHCAKTFNLKLHLDFHKMVCGLPTDNLRPFKCDLCAKYFFLKVNLDFHRNACGLIRSETK